MRSKILVIGPVRVGEAVSMSDSGGIFKRQSGQMKAVVAEAIEVLEAAKEVVAKVKSDPPVGRYTVIKPGPRAPEPTPPGPSAQVSKPSGSIPKPGPVPRPSVTQAKVAAPQPLPPARSVDASSDPITKRSGAFRPHQPAIPRSTDPPASLPVDVVFDEDE